MIYIHGCHGASKWKLLHLQISEIFGAWCCRVDGKVFQEPATIARVLAERIFPGLLGSGAVEEAQVVQWQKWGEVRAGQRRKVGTKTKIEANWLAFAHQRNPKVVVNQCNPWSGRTVLLGV